VVGSGVSAAAASSASTVCATAVIAASRLCSAAGLRKEGSEQARVVKAKVSVISVSKRLDFMLLSPMH
jgi:hypothetical protein